MNEQSKRTETRGETRGDGVSWGGGAALEASLCSPDEWWDSDGGGRCPRTIVQVRVACSPRSTVAPATQIMGRFRVLF